MASYVTVWSGGAPVAYGARYSGGLGTVVLILLMLDLADVLGRFLPRMRLQNEELA